MNSSLMLSLILFSFAFGLTPKVPSGYTIAPWYKFKPAAITYSFDDATNNQVPIAIPLLDKYGFKASFNIITSLNVNWAGYASAAKNGHEIASHTVKHLNLQGESKQSQDDENKKSKAIIEQKIGQECVTMVYPYCGIGDREITGKYYISARTCSGQLIDSNPKDMFDLSSFIVGRDSTNQRANDLNKIADQALQSHKWAVFLIHGIDNDGGYSSLDSGELNSHLNYVKSKGEFWVATFKDISKYILEANSLIIEENDSGEVSVSCGYQTDLTKLDVPVTVSRKSDEKCKPSGVTAADGSKVESELKDNQLVFDVVPGKKYKITCK